MKNYFNRLFSRIVREMENSNNLEPNENTKKKKRAKRQTEA